MLLISLPTTARLARQQQLAGLDACCSTLSRCCSLESKWSVHHGLHLLRMEQHPFHHCSMHIETCSPAQTTVEMFSGPKGCT